MMHGGLLQSAVLKHVRAHGDVQVTFSPNTTVIVGKNGSGKTSIIEAIVIALTGKSFKSVDEEIVTKDKDWYRVDIQQQDVTRTVKYTVGGKKTFIVGEKTYYRLPNQKKESVILFEPSDLNVFTQSPSKRRDFIDTIIASLMPEYAALLHRYDRVLHQRNAALKSSIQQDLFAWNVQLASLAADIVTRRQQIIADINEVIADTYQSIAGNKDTITLSYEASLTYSSKERILQELEKNTQRDRILQYTSVGPHRDDINFFLNTSALKTTASRGEMRTVMLAIKFIQAAMLEKTTQIKPLILLDDVFGELDDIHQHCLVVNFSDHQIIITATESPAIANSTVVSLG